jgi:hypothetical protein
MLAYAEGNAIISPKNIDEVAGDLDLRPGPGRPMQAALGAKTGVVVRTAPARPAELGLQPKTLPLVAETGHANGGANGTAPARVAPLPTFDRYQSDAAKPSRFRRLAGKLLFGNRASETP